MTKQRCVVLLIFSSIVLAVPATHAAEEKIHWRDWSDDIFDIAQKQQRFVLLDLEAMWCHWCHVMDKETYGNPLVIELINKKYIAVRVDQESNPALANRYEDYGWPATIVFAPDGTEIVTRSGYLPPVLMVSMLQAIIDDPSPGPSVVPRVAVKPATQALLTPQQTTDILSLYEQLYDVKYGGWGTVHKYIHADSLEYAMRKAQSGDASYERRAKQTLTAALQLIDPVWGGVYQYSDQLDWTSPHYEKIMLYQADNLRLYSMAYALWGEARYLAAARAIYTYLTTILMHPAGVFYTSQDADLNKSIDGAHYYALNDAKRRQLGMPKINKAVYTRENAWAIVALLTFYNVVQEPKIRMQAIQAAHWIIDHRRLTGGGFKHGEQDPGGPYLGDNVAMAQAFLSLYKATGDRHWLALSENTVQYIQGQFEDKKNRGYITAVELNKKVGVFKIAVKQIDENMALTRLSNLLYHYTGNRRYKTLAQSAMRYLASQDITRSRRFLVGLLLTDEELANDPVHITVVGPKRDDNANKLYAAAQKIPAFYKRLEWWDKQEGKLPNADIQYPDLPYAAAFACTNNRCSLPVTKPDKITAAIQRMRQ